MRAKPVKAVVVPVPAEVSGGDRDLLTNAFRTGLIVGWKRDEHGYRVTLADRRDDHVEITKLTSYLEKLRKETR
jgi:hypothetical protein